MDKWIPVTERHPEPFKRVIVARPGLYPGEERDFGFCKQLRQNQGAWVSGAAAGTASPEQWEIIIEGMSKKKETRGDLVGKNKQSPIDPGDDDFGSICVCAVRYSLGRRTYMPHLVMGFIRPLLPDMPRRALWCMEQDVAEAVRNGVCGDEKIDKPAWVGFLAAVRDEMMRRINNGT